MQNKGKTEAKAHIKEEEINIDVLGVQAYLDREFACICLRLSG